MKRPVRFDRDGDVHFDVASAFIKSMRGSDPDAAIYWLAVMIAGGEDPKFIARRVIVFASEDVGNADPRALEVAVAAAARGGVRRPAGGAHQPRPGRRLRGAGAEVERGHHGHRRRARGGAAVRQPDAAGLDPRRATIRAPGRSAAAPATSTRTATAASSRRSATCPTSSATRRFYEPMRTASRRACRAARRPAAPSRGSRALASRGSMCISRALRGACGRSAAPAITSSPASRGLRRSRPLRRADLDRVPPCPAIRGRPRGARTRHGGVHEDPHRASRGSACRAPSRPARRPAGRTGSARRGSGSPRPPAASPSSRTRPPSPSSGAPRGS